MRTEDQTALLGLRAWEVQQRNRRRRVVFRALMLLVSTSTIAYALPERINPLVHAGVIEGRSSDAKMVRIADDVAAAIKQRNSLAPPGLKTPPPLTNAPPAPLPPPDYAAADLTCLAKAIYFEARGETLEGQIAVAQVVMNRVKSSATTICQVVMRGVERGEKCQFSFACHSHAQPPETNALWQQARWIAEEVATGRAFLRELDKSEHYHTVAVAPVWRLGLKPVRRIGQHIFYVHPSVTPDTSLSRNVKTRWDNGAQHASIDMGDLLEGQHKLTATLSNELPVVTAPKPAPVVVKRAAPVTAPKTEVFNPFASDHR